MARPDSDHQQQDFFPLLPGSAGGRALRDQKGRGHFSKLAKEAAANRTAQERSEIARKAAKERIRRIQHEPRQITYEMRGIRVTERIVPWWGNQRGKRRRKRPEYVHIELESEDLDG